MTCLRPGYRLLARALLAIDESIRLSIGESPLKKLDLSYFEYSLYMYYGHLEKSAQILWL